MACGAISIPAALLLFTFPEPARRSLATEQAVSPHEAFASVRDRWTIFAPLFLANAATIMLSNKNIGCQHTKGGRRRMLTGIGD
jgi:hypothetical protein